MPILRAPRCEGRISKAPPSGFTAAQLYSTASYQAGDLTGINLGNGNDLTGWNFAGKNLTNANFDWCHADEYQFYGRRGAGGEFPVTQPTHGFTAAQLYSTASYQAGDLTGINLVGNNLTGWNFAGKNLTNANFRASHADRNGLHRRRHSRCATLGNLTSAVVTNLIQPNGHVNGLDLGNSQPLLVVRNYLGNAAQGLGPIPVTVDQHFVMGPGGTLQIVLDADAWDSRISFAPGIPVTLGGGTLQLAFAPDVNLASQVGRTFDLFDWTGVTPTGVFSVASPYIWNLSKLYTTGEVTLTSVAVCPATTTATAWSDRRTTTSGSPASAPRPISLPTAMAMASSMRRITPCGATTWGPRSGPAAARRYPPPHRCRPACRNRRLC